MSIKVLIVDDSAFMRNMLNRMVAKDKRFEIVGQAANGKEAIEQVARLKPDIVTLDIEMPVMDGLAALKEIMAKTPLPVVMVSSLTTEGATATLEALDLGAIDFIPKAMDGGAQNNILNASQLLLEKLYAASQAKIGRPSLPLRSPQKAPQVEQKPARVPRSQIRSERVEPTEKKEPAAPVRKRPLSSTHRMPSARLMVLGSSTGGPRALQEVLPYIPAHVRVPVVVAQHMPGTFTGPMAERLNSSCLARVVEVKNGDLLKAGTIYIAPGGKHTRVVADGNQLVAKVTEDKGESVYKPSVDILADSAVQASGPHTLAVMLTGMGADGAKGFASLKRAGGYVIAQDEETSVVYGMPKAVAPIADEILPIGDIASTIKRLLS